MRMTTPLTVKMKSTALLTQRWLSPTLLEVLLMSVISKLLHLFTSNEIKEKNIIITQKKTK